MFSFSLRLHDLHVWHSKYMQGICHEHCSTFLHAFIQKRLLLEGRRTKSAQSFRTGGGMHLMAM